MKAPKEMLKNLSTEEKQNSARQKKCRKCCGGFQARCRSRIQRATRKFTSIKNHDFHY